MNKFKLGIFATHPIQYYAPIFRELSSRSIIETTVFYDRYPNDKEQGLGFGIPFQWDVDLLSGYRHLVLSKPFKSAISDTSLDACLLMGWGDPFYRKLIAASRAPEKPLMVRGDSHLRTPGSSIKKIVREVTHRRLFRRFTACLAVGALSNEYFRHFGATHIVRSPHCVDNEWFFRMSQEAQKTAQGKRARLGIEKDAVVFLFAGKFQSVKRIMDFLKAIQILNADSTLKNRFFGLLVGDGSLKKEYENFVKSNHLPVFFLGFYNQSQMPEAYAMSNVLVLPSESETWGLVVNEAMACGLPVIVSDGVGCAADLIAEGVTGFTFPKGNIKALSERMRQMIRLAPQSMKAKVMQKISLYSPTHAAAGIEEAALSCR